jgi:hypothetical protein
MSSILEALRELENVRGRKTTPVVTPVDTPGRVDRAFDAAMPIVGGAVVGAVVLGVALWALSSLRFSSPSSAPVAPAAAPEAATPAAPTWLDTAEAPRARMGTAAVAERAPRVEVARVPAPEAPRTVEHAAEPERRVAERPAAPPPSAAPREEPPRTAAAPVAAAPPRPAAKPERGTGPLVVEMIHYSPVAAERTATLRVNGRRVTLHQRESAEGVEVQLIQPDGVYVQRGAEVFLATIDR